MSTSEPTKESTEKVIANYNAKRVCQIIKLKPSYESSYIQIHANPWPGVLAALARSNIIDYSIHYFEPLHLLIAHFKYTGLDYEADMKKIAEDPDTQRWWKVTDEMQESLVEAEGSGTDLPWWKSESVNSLVNRIYQKYSDLMGKFEDSRNVHMYFDKASMICLD